MEEETDTHTDTIDLTRAPNLGLSAQPAFANMEPLHVEEGAHVTFIAYEPEQWEVLSLFRRCVKTVSVTCVCVCVCALDSALACTVLLSGKCCHCFDGASEG